MTLGKSLCLNTAIVEVQEKYIYTHTHTHNTYAHIYTYTYAYTYISGTPLYPESVTALGSRWSWDLGISHTYFSARVLEDTFLFLDSARSFGKNKDSNNS